jgi:hypothetical protein
MNPILVAALAGAGGGAIGAGVAWALERLLNRRPKWLTLIPVFLALLAVSLSRTLQPSVEDQALAGLDTFPSIRALKTHYPDDYSKLEAGVRAAVRADSLAASDAAIAGVLGEVLRRQRPKADAESSYALFQVSREEGSAIRAIDPEGCIAFMEGRGARQSLAKVLTPQIQARDAEATSRMLEQTASRPAPRSKPMTLDESARFAIQAVSTLPAQQQDVVIKILEEERAPATPVEVRAMCDFNIAVADAILSQPRALAGATVRALWARP